MVYEDLVNDLELKDQYDVLLVIGKKQQGRRNTNGQRSK